MRRKEDTDHKESFAASFLSLTDAKHAVVIPSCRSGVFHTMKYYQGKTSRGLQSGITFSAMKACMDYFTKGFESSLFDSVHDLDLENPGSMVLFTHLFRTRELSVALNQDSILIEDCAHCFIPGFTHNPFHLTGKAAVFSFGVGKSLNLAGGGILLTNDQGLMEFVRERVKVREASGIEFLPRALKTWIMSLATAKLGFSLVTFPFIRALNVFNENLLDHALNEEVRLGDLEAQVNSSVQINEVQAYMGMRQVEGFSVMVQKRKAVIALMLPKISQIYHPYLLAEFTYLMVPFHERDEVRKKLWTLNIDTKTSDMTSYHDEHHPMSVQNRSYLEIPFSEKWSEADVRHICDALNQCARHVMRELT